MKVDNYNSHLVYSTGLGSLCLACSKPKNSCICRQIKRKIMPETSGAVRIRYEVAGRKGKGMTLITGLPLSKDGLLALAKKLKQQLATGGAVKDFIIQLQGDQCKRAEPILRKLGYSG